MRLSIYYIYKTESNFRWKPFHAKTTAPTLTYDGLLERLHHVACSLIYRRRYGFNIDAYVFNTGPNLRCLAMYQTNQLLDINLVLIKMINYVVSEQ